MNIVDLMSAVCISYSTHRQPKTARRVAVEIQHCLDGDVNWPMTIYVLVGFIKLFGNLLLRVKM